VQIIPRQRWRASGALRRINRGRHRRTIAPGLPRPEADAETPAHQTGRTVTSRGGLSRQCRTQVPPSRHSASGVRHITMNMNSFIYVNRMRFVHKKVPKSLVFSHILSAWHRRDLCSASLIAARSRRKLSGDYNKPAIYGITCTMRCTIGRRPLIRQPCAKVKRTLPSSCVLGLAASQHRNFCTANLSYIHFNDEADLKG
jgi:hypothetical protein